MTIKRRISKIMVLGGDSSRKVVLDDWANFDILYHVVNKGVRKLFD